jgi:integral membrane protein
MSIKKTWEIYRALAILVGGVLAVLTFIAMPYRYLVVQEEVAAYSIAWMIHGYLFPLYVIATFVLSLKLSWPLGKTLLVMLAGTVPMMSFIAERKLAEEVKPRLL